MEQLRGLKLRSFLAMRRLLKRAQNLYLHLKCVLCTVRTLSAKFCSQSSALNLQSDVNKYNFSRWTFVQLSLHRYYYILWHIKSDTLCLFAAPYFSLLQLLRSCTVWNKHFLWIFVLIPFHLLSSWPSALLGFLNFGSCLDFTAFLVLTPVCVWVFGFLFWLFSDTTVFQFFPLFYSYSLFL